MKEITEGKATVSFAGDDASVFYNPVQEFNRDLSVLVLRQFVNELGLNCASTSDLAECQEGTDANESIKNGDEISPKRSRLENKPDVDKNSGIRILEALSASGLRAIRYAKEVNGVKEVIANDFSESAYHCIIRNVQANNVSNIVSPSKNDAMIVMHQNKFNVKRFHVVDLDPYGSPAHFLDAAVQCVADGGILMVTCTDMATLCGNTPEACFTKYGSMSLKSKCCHEIALRILLHSLETHANRYARFIEPLLSVHVDFYIRIFVRLQSGAAKAKNSCCKTSMIYQCCGCESIVLQKLGRKSITSKGGIKYQNAFGPSVSPKCDHCGDKYHIAGPIWSDRLYDPDFVKGMLSIVQNLKETEKLGTQKRITGMLSVISEELIDVPLFYSVSRLASFLRCPAPSFVAIRSAILHAGFRVSESHVCPQAIKTDAPNEIIWDIFRCWARENNVDASSAPENSASRALLSTPPKINANFEPTPLAEPLSRVQGILRFQPKLHKNWGPKNKAKGSASSIGVAYFSGNKEDHQEDSQKSMEK